MANLNPNRHLRCWRFQLRAHLGKGHFTLFAKETSNLLTGLWNFDIFPTARVPRFPSTFPQRHVHFRAT